MLLYRTPINRLTFELTLTVSETCELYMHRTANTWCHGYLHVHVSTGVLLRVLLIVQNTPYNTLVGFKIGIHDICFATIVQCTTKVADEEMHLKCAAVLKPSIQSEGKSIIKMLWSNSFLFLSVSCGSKHQLKQGFHLLKLAWKWVVIPPDESSQNQSA